LVSSRRRVVRRLVAAGATGIALAGLAIAIGDVAVGARLAARDYRESIAPRLGRDDALVRAWLGVVSEQPDEAVVAILRALVDAGASLDQLFAHAPTDRLARLRRGGVVSTPP
ncbi:MAG TPA: hypothetical protein VGO00_13725, partial [Kofleriaceae bacterium]|nr:hypothetical protein [Kofleriaceae bacterium]